MRGRAQRPAPHLLNPKGRLATLFGSRPIAAPAGQEKG
jgi:hypothetical protein